MMINKITNTNLKRILKNKLLLCFIFTCLVSCESDSGYINYKSLTNDGFSSSPIVFNIPENVIDSGRKNLFIRLRNDNSYLYSNIFLIATIKAGKEVIFKDTLEYAMANPDGSWIGNGFTEIKDSKLWWKEGVVFPKERPISISITQAVREFGKEKGVSKLKGIESVGISIEDQ
tara:strand:+ start:3335 stop:3856 length:522 start_codon:yes stop_codon:yes gene_type:complete